MATRHPANARDRGNSRQHPAAIVRTAGNRHPRPRRTSNSFSEFTGHFESYLRQHALSPVTIRNYLADLRAFLRWRSTRKRASSEISPADFRTYREHLCRETTHSPATVNRRLQSLRLFGRFLHETGQVAENPTREITLLRNGHNHDELPRTLSSLESSQLLAAVTEARPSLTARDRAIIQLMLNAGLRVHEVAALKLVDVVSMGKKAQIQVSGNSASTPRLVPLHPTVAQVLRDYLPTRPAVPHVEHLFLSQRGQSLSQRSIQRLVATYARAAGLSGVSAQLLRNTFAKTMLEQTQDAELVAQWLGQRNRKALARYCEKETRK